MTSRPFGPGTTPNGSTKWHPPLRFLFLSLSLSHTHTIPWHTLTASQPRCKGCSHSGPPSGPSQQLRYLPMLHNLPLSTLAVVPFDGSSEQAGKGDVHGCYRQSAATNADNPAILPLAEPCSMDGKVTDSTGVLDTSTAFKLVH
uniref:Putative secreted protein n=1 Tax=Anopheles darlingi TaxID=43151 RepID=A0A2M4DPE7_ANODA